MLEKLNNAKVLVVGAGGIGCELLKNLVLSGFKTIHVVDLDTIDVSNLNRQFLFRSQHVGQPKAVVASQAALEFNPTVQITPYHGNIKTHQFGMDFFSQFDLVFNALDNIDARRHVNRLCLATDVPLIESGTTGYLGQVSVIKKGETECYECTAKNTQKVYPICTIRSTPTKPVHCIVWAKECYKLLFGKMEDSMLWEDPNGEEKSVFMDLVKRPESSEDLTTYGRNVFRGLFELEIQKKLSMDLYKGAEKVPIAIQYELLDHSIQTEIPPSTLPDRVVWKVEECAERFIQCIVNMYASPETKDLIGDCVFDKDDVLAMEFVTVASNLRSHVFHIEQKSLYDCKGIAGNIIPAIATTNAIIAGLQVAEAFKILQAAKPIGEACKYTYCNRYADSRGTLLNAMALQKPNPECFVCSQTVLKLYIDTKTTTLEELVDKVLRGRLGVNEPSVSIGPSTIYEEGEDSEESLRSNLPKTLSDLPAGGIIDGVQISIEDFSQDFTCSIAVFHSDSDIFDEKETPEQFVLGSNAERPVRKEQQDDISTKRKLSDSEEQIPEKRLKAVEIIE